MREAGNPLDFFCASAPFLSLDAPMILAVALLSALIAEKHLWIQCKNFPA
jgi:hypothetical protein